MIDNRFSMAWAPAQNRLPNPFGGRGAALGQKIPEHDNKIVAIGADILVGLGTGYMGYPLQRADNRWATFWFVVTGMVGIKFLHDLSRP